MDITTFTHPLTLSTIVKALKPACACAGANKFVKVSGKVLKVINNNSGIWYYLDSGTTVKADWVESVSQ